MNRNLSEFHCGQCGQCGQDLQDNANTVVALSTLPNSLCPHEKHCGQRIVRTVDSTKVFFSITYVVCPHCPRCPHQKTGTCQTHRNNTEYFSGGVQWDFGSKSNRAR